MNTCPMGLAVITGASSGIGAIYADRLAHRGYDLLLVARSQERMDDLAKKLAADTRCNVEILAAVPGFVKHSSGTIINLSSIVAIGPETLNGVYGATNAFVLGFSQSLRKKLAGSGVTVQVVLSGAATTDLWKKAGKPVELLPREIVMPAEDMVDAALSGLDQGEFVTIPALPDAGQWQAYEAARQALLPNLSRREPADRYAMVRAAEGARNVEN